MEPAPRGVSCYENKRKRCKRRAWPVVGSPTSSSCPVKSRNARGQVLPGSSLSSACLRLLLKLLGSWEVMSSCCPAEAARKHPTGTVCVHGRADKCSQRHPVRFGSASPSSPLSFGPDGKTHEQASKAPGHEHTRTHTSACDLMTQS